MPDGQDKSHCPSYLQKSLGKAGNGMAMEGEVIVFAGKPTFPSPSSTRNSYLKNLCSVMLSHECYNLNFIASEAESIFPNDFNTFFW